MVSRGAVDGALSAAASELQCALRRFKGYPVYKTSGVDWLVEIPAHWELKRLKFSAQIEAGQSPPSELVADGLEGLPFLQGNAEFGPLNPRPRQICDAAPKRAKSGDILLSVRAPVGALNIADQPYGIGRGLCAITPARGVDLQFGFYLLTAIRHQLDAVGTGSTYDAVTVSEVGDLRALLPALPEQHAIAAFLDQETARIGALVAKKEQLIAWLQERRTALITRAITRGLDPNVPLKEFWRRVAWGNSGALGGEAATMVSIDSKRRGFGQHRVRGNRFRGTHCACHWREWSDGLRQPVKRFSAGHCSRSCRCALWERSFGKSPGLGDR